MKKSNRIRKEKSIKKFETQKIEENSAIKGGEPNRIAVINDEIPPV